MASIWRTGKDTLQNGTILGALVGVAAVWGDSILGWMEGIIPSSWIVLGSWSIPIYVIAAGALVGYFIDRY